MFALVGWWFVADLFVLAKQSPFAIGWLGWRLEVDEAVWYVWDPDHRLGTDSLLMGVVVLEAFVARKVLGSKVLPEGYRVRPQGGYSRCLVVMVFHCMFELDRVCLAGAVCDAIV
jgi:hypothetical protein